MRTLTVELGDRSYPIHIGAGLMARADLLRPAIAGRRVMVVSNDVVAPLYLGRLQGALAGLDVDTHIVPDGEAHKHLGSLEALITALLTGRHDRGTTLIALGGGVIGDLTGFAAACYQRGVDFIQVPTTLLAQVDASVGGKTAVNHPLGKNMIGAFHQPRCVVVDTDTLHSLPPREFSAGLAEIIKYGLIRDPAFFDWLEANTDALLAGDREALAHAVERSCQNKAEVVAEDEREQGLRALLNLGHTFGHAIETGLGYGQWLHGEAVGAGICIAAELSARLGWLSGADVARIRALIERCRLPAGVPAELDPERMLELMQVDKKARDGRIRLILLRAIGEAVVTADYEPQLMADTVRDAVSTAA